VPTALKDLFDYHPGWPSTHGGVRALRDYIPTFYCTYAERMLAAGAIIVGKTNAPTMGFRGTTDNFLFGPSRNPFDPERNPGGSSGGSIQIPAAWCGVYGYKPSFGRVPYTGRPNGFGGINPFLFEGVLTRSVRDAALAMTVLGGYDPRDPFALPGQVDYEAAVDQVSRPLRVAYSPDLRVFPVEPRIEETVAAAVRDLERAGAVVDTVDIAMPAGQRELSDLWCRLIAPLNVKVFEQLKGQGVDLLTDHADDFPPEYLEWVRCGYRLTTLDVAQDQALRTAVHDTIVPVFADHDVLITPTLGCSPVRNGTDGNTVGPRQVNGVEVDPLIGWCLTYPVNFTGQPAASVPAGLVDGLPVGMQIIGARYDDATVLAVSAAVERIQPWLPHYELCRNRVG
jgi:amidase